jgi:hypothetical protein
MMYPRFLRPFYSLSALRGSLCLAALGWLAAVPLAKADMIIETTRVIYPEARHMLNPIALSLPVLHQQTMETLQR